MIEIAEERESDVAVLAVTGRIDSNTAKTFEERLTALFKTAHTHVVVDLKKIAYVSSAGCRALLVAGRLADRTDGKLALCGMTAEVRRVFDIGGLTELFTIYSSREEGLARIRGA
jgi:anti-sigma B factor antagonist